jgi:hypothetical protein
MIKIKKGRMIKMIQSNTVLLIVLSNFKKHKNYKLETNGDVLNVRISNWHINL